jgi:hypothetical protein
LRTLTDWGDTSRLLHVRYRPVTPQLSTRPTLVKCRRTHCKGVHDTGGKAHGAVC